MRNVGTASAIYPSAAYAWYVVFMLLLAGMTSYLDRYLLALLIAPVRGYLKITDTQVSLLQGLAFALFYVAAGLPFGRLVDRTNRRNVILVGVLVWSLFTIGCGLAETYAQMFVARLGVGIGEACLGPAAFSLIADYFTRERRGRAMSVYNLSNYLGGGASLLIGGLILKGLTATATVDLPLLGVVPTWKAAFFVAAAPGFAIAVLLLTVKETSRKEVAHPALTDGAMRLGIYLPRHARVYCALYLVFTLNAFVGLTFASWGPTFFTRRFGLSPAEVGLITGPIGIVFGTAGALLSGILGDWLVGKGRTRFLIPLIFWPIMTAGVICLCLAPNLAIALAGEAIVLFGSGLGLVAGPPTFQDVTPNQLRGQVQALYFMLSGLLGLGVAPTAVALVTDFVFGRDDAIRYSLLVVLVPVALLAFVVCFLSQSRYAHLRNETWPFAYPSIQKQN
ncbi:spinster family MFS transporter [Bradyrhizobium sp. STM 3566]|uniref:spinster family MFS transporter n=1 Tax=Bradyrhizobium sp. STM 3566 TaxID=578928 RepID=UPI00388F6432